MAKVLNLQNNISEFSFLTPKQELNLYTDWYRSSELGQLEQSIPFEELCRTFSRKLPKKRRGPTSVFSLRAKLGLMFLKSYTGFSDRVLMERLYSDWMMQFFCQVYITPQSPKINYKIISKIRSELGGAMCKMDLIELQKIFSDYWKLGLSNTNIGLIDATCYESHIRYPTDEKLLWEGCEWVYKKLKGLCKYANIRLPRSKYLEQKRKQLEFAKTRRKTHKMKRRRRKSLLYLLVKLIRQVIEVEKSTNCPIEKMVSFQERFLTICKMYGQQKEMYDRQVNVINDRIVSLDKPYIRPIVRGKEIKRVEFGAKVNLLQVDGISFIQKLSFDAFNEGTQLIASIQFQRVLFGKVSHTSADQIFATNKNRKYCSSQGIQTNFVRKGKAGKNEQQRIQIKKILDKERATRLEGAFGNHKNHYSLNKIKARKEHTEVLWIFFGIFTANAVTMSKRTKVKQKVLCL